MANILKRSPEDAVDSLLRIEGSVRREDHVRVIRYCTQTYCYCIFYLLLSNSHYEFITMNANTTGSIPTSTKSGSFGFLEQPASADRRQSSTIGQTDEQHYQSRRKDLVTGLAIMLLVTVGLAGAGALFLACPGPFSDEMIRQNAAAYIVFAPIILPAGGLYMLGGACVLIGAVVGGLASISLLVLLLLDCLATAREKDLPRLCNFLPKIWGWILPKSV